MGAVLDYFIIGGNKSKDEIIEIAEHVMEERRIQYGYDTYGGHIGLKSSVRVHNTPVDSLDAARAFIERHSDKWGDEVLCVPYTQEITVQNSEARQKREELKRQISATREVLRDYARVVLDIRKRAKYTACSVCGSQLSTAYLTNLVCPVCIGDLRTPAEKEYMGSGEDAIRNMENEINGINALLAEVSGVDTQWMIGAMCPT